MCADEYVCTFIVQSRLCRFIEANGNPVNMHKRVYTYYIHASDRARCKHAHPVRIHRRKFNNATDMLGIRAEGGAKLLMSLISNALGIAGLLPRVSDTILVCAL